MGWFIENLVQPQLSTALTIIYPTHLLSNNQVERSSHETNTIAEIPNVSGLISDPVLANGVISLIMSMSITVGSGFIRNFQTLHPIFELLSYGSMHRYASSTLAANEFGGLNLSCR